MAREFVSIRGEERKPVRIRKGEKRPLPKRRKGKMRGRAS